MTRRKNIKRIDPKYFLEETALRDEVVNETITEGGPLSDLAAAEGKPIPTTPRRPSPPRPGPKFARTGLSIPSTMAPEKADDIARELARRGHFPRPPGSPSKLRYRQDYDRYLKQAQKTISADPPLEVVDDVIDVVDPDKKPPGKIVKYFKGLNKKYGPRVAKQAIKKAIVGAGGAAAGVALAPEILAGLTAAGWYDAAAEVGSIIPGWSGGGKLLPTKDVDGSQEPYGIRDIGLGLPLFRGPEYAPSKKSSRSPGHTSVPDYEYWEPGQEQPVYDLPEPPAKKSSVTLDDGSALTYDPATFKRDPRLKSREIREEEDLEARLANLGREPREKDPLADLRAAAEEPPRAPRGRKWHDDYAKRVSAEAQPNLAVQKPVSSPRDQYGSEELAPRASSLGRVPTWLDDPDTLAAAQRGEAEVEVQNAYDQYVLDHPESGLSPTWLSDPDTLAAYADDGSTMDLEAFSGKEKQKKAVPPSYKYGSTPMRETLRQMVMEELGALKEAAEPVDLKENVELAQINETLTRWQKIIK